MGGGGGGGGTRSEQAKSIGFIFSCTFLLIRMNFDVMMKKFNCTIHCYTNLIDPEIDSRSQVYKKAKTSAPIISQTL